MAPMGPKSSASGNRLLRNTKPTIGGKASTRNGVSKRRGGLPLVDRDGDLNMDAPISTIASQAYSKRADKITGTKSSKRNTRPAAKAEQMIQKVMNGDANQVSRGRGNRRADAVPPVTLKVEGLKASKAASNPGGGLKELLSFLERKAQTIGNTSRHIRIKKSQVRGDFVYILANKEDSEEILKVNNFTFAGVALQITAAPEGLPDRDPTPLSSVALEMKERLQGTLSSRYDGNAKLLNLSALGDDPILNQMGFFNGESSPEKLFRALMAVCDGFFKTAQEKRDAVVSITLAANNIDDVQQIMSLADTFPDIINLDLSRNQLQNVKALQKWRRRLRSVQTVLLNDNPIEMTTPDYKKELVNWFPQLLNLSGTQVRTPEEVAAKARPTPIPQYGPDFRDINGIGEGFITEFLTLYDGNRDNLAATYYDEKSTFSIAVDTPAHCTPTAPSSSLGGYIKLSRNHVKRTHPSARQQRLFTGANQIQAVWKQLPATRHPNIRAQFHKYIVDCHPVHGLADPSGQSSTGVDGLMITLHGEFEDQEQGTFNTATRSFSRTFILGPGAPGRNPIVVVSDMLSIKPKSLPTTSPSTQTITQTITAEGQLQEQMLFELCRQTGMILEYSRLCLDGANWNFDQALTSFHENKTQLPMEAFARQ
ncbi:hypothetical protein GGR50DRAFT_667377 [Xylaria sp. CBS 124048]|nr:hypothetical protein GGR50DRAFT_667377 [Xylaria sp. CBS 124048]